jgi:hypothetical protein
VPIARAKRQFEIDGDGLKIGDKLEGLTGVLGWSALREAKGRDAGNNGSNSNRGEDVSFR